jgi:hypothetical protein
MAAARHNLSRRALLGVGVVAPLGLGSAFGVCEAGSAAADAVSEAALSRRRWGRALAALERASARIAAFQAETSLLPASRRDCEAMEERLTDLECARLPSLARVLGLPAPDLPALALKIELAVGGAAWELTDGDAFMVLPKADAQRLCRGV